MHADTPILYIVLRKSLQLNDTKVALCVADAMQRMMLRYFTLQVIAVKAHLNSLDHSHHIRLTTKWLSSQSEKSIISVSDDIWERLKDDFEVGNSCYCLKSLDPKHIETTLVLWPIRFGDTPSYLLTP